MVERVAERPLDGRVALVTGSSTGIGEAIVRRLARAGASVVVNSAQSPEAGAAVAASLPDGVYVKGSISNDDEAQHLVSSSIERWGRLDILVNNAGTTELIPHADIDAASVDIWRRIFEVNVFGTWRMCQLALPALAATGAGAIINITSLAGIRCTGSSIPYAASKAALNHQTRLLARAVGPSVRVNAVAPGLIDTRWTASWSDARTRVETIAPLHRSGTPEEIADVALAVATSTYLTGQVISVDGGLGLV